MRYVAFFNISLKILQRTTINTGTPLYSSPEEFKVGEKIATMPADMWSLGVVLYVLVCGKLPFEALTLSKLRDKILHDKLDIPRSISESCAELLRGLLCKDSTQRYDIHRASAHPWIQQRRRSNVSSSSSGTTTTNATTTSVYPNAYWFSAPIASYDKTKSPVLSARRQQVDKQEEPPPIDLFDLEMPKKAESRGLHDWMYEIEEEDETEDEEEEEEGGYWGRGPRRLSPKTSPKAAKNEKDLIPPNKTRGIIMNCSEESVSFGEEEDEEEIEGDGPGWYFGGE